MFTFPVGFFNFIVSSGGGGTTDPYAADVVLFLKGNGTNGSTAITDSSPSPKTISVFGNAQISTAQSKYGGSSLLFDGSGDYLTTTPLNLVNVDFTVEYWIYVLTAKLGVILSSYTFPNQANTFVTHTNWGIITAQNGLVGADTPAITNNTWIHVAITYLQSSNQLKIYLNGVLSQSKSVTINSQHSTCWIGGAPNDNNLGSWWLHAYVDSLRVTRGVVRYTSNFNPETDTYLNSSSETTDPYGNNVVLFLKGDGTNGSTNILDSSPNPKTISVFGTAQISTAQSKYGGSSLYFDGTNNCFIGTPVDSIYTLGSSNFTLEMWVYPFAVNPNGIMAWNNSAVFPSIVTLNPVYGNFDTTFSFWRQNATVTNLQNLTTNVWQHHALVREGNSFRWYLNGVLTVSFSSNESFTGSRIVIGANGVNNYLSFARFYLSHLRLTKAVRYTANFNPETNTYLNV
jgi:hypothetical protein